jgi:TonB family protein
MLLKSIRLGLFGAALWAAIASGQDSFKKLSKMEAARATVTRVEPEYPAIAKQLKLQGSVELEAVVGEDGSVGDVQIISGNPVLTKAAVQAVKKWKFTPAIEDGKPIKAVAPVELLFKI